MPPAPPAAPPAAPPPARPKSRFRGVYWYARGNKWHARVHHINRSSHVGFFSNELDAALACRAAFEKRVREEPNNVKAKENLRVLVSQLKRVETKNEEDEFSFLDQAVDFGLPPEPKPAEFERECLAALHLCSPAEYENETLNEFVSMATSVLVKRYPVSVDGDAYAVRLEVARKYPESGF